MEIVRGKAPAGTISLSGTVAETIFLGAATRIIVDLTAGKRIAVLEQNDLNTTNTTLGSPVTVAVHPQFLAPLT
jgi:ABC-type Fe3+/spermidine/putrescine transport system ATPase subunit